MTAPSPYPRQDCHAQAAYWFVELGKDECSPTTRKAFEAWLEASVVNREAYERIKAAWRDSGVLEASTALEAVRHDALIDSVRRRAFWNDPKRLAVLAGSVAASLLLMVSAIIILPFQPEGPASEDWIVVENTVADPILDATAIRAVTTGVGERNSLSLADGTLMELNTSTSVRIAFTETRREIVLLRGQAVFSVFKDAERPFVVIAGDRTVTATGTEFEVRVEEDDVEVTLLEGSVEVAPLRTERVLNSPLAGSEVVELSPGERLSARVGVTEQLGREDLGRALSWREGWLRFENDTLLEVIEEINRYSHQTFALESEDLGELRVSGNFRAGSIDSFASAIVEVYPVRTYRDPERATIILIGWRD